MPHLKRHLTDRGVNMQRAFVTTPVCCPSRSSMLTGQYVHNHRVFTNNENCTSATWRRQHEPVTFGKQLNDAGYRTAYIGKYLNKYDGTYVPPGWDRWLGQVKNTKFYNYSVNEDGQLSWHGANYSRDYFTDIVTNRSLDILREWTSGGDEAGDQQAPFLLVMSYPAPHGPEDAAPQHQSLFANDHRHKTASYNRAPSPDKEWLLRRAQPLTPLHQRFTDTLQRKRLQTLQSVDEGLRRLSDWLDSESSSEISNNTFVFYTSDHGYHLGQFGLLKGKSTPYEFDIRVPLIVRGPGVPAGAVLRQPVLNIDLAPTLLDLAGVAPARPMDGASYAPLLLQSKNSSGSSNSSTPWRRSFLVERGRMTFRKLNLRRELEAVAEELAEILGPEKVGEVRVWAEVGEPVLSKSGAFTDEVLRILDTGEAEWAFLTADFSLEVTMPGKTATTREGHERLCNQRHIRAALSCSRGDKFHCVPSNRLAGRYERVKCPGKAACRCRRSVVLPISQYVWKHCWRLQGRTRRRFRSTRSIVEPEEDEYDAEDVAFTRDIDDDSSYFNGNDIDSDYDEGDDYDDIECEYSSLSDLLRDRRMMRLTQRRLDAVQARLNQIRKAMRRNKNTLMRLLGGCACSRDRFSVRVDELPPGRRRLADLLLSTSLRKRRLRRRKRKGGECNLRFMSCFFHDKSHWKTPPYWNDSSICFCGNANNFTYWCLRTVDSTEESLYCEFITGFISYYNITADPHQLVNLAAELPFQRRLELQAKLNRLKSCRGATCSTAGA
uniref:Sulfatase domain-containing protein n=1 Tax=Macrostomum lignano TaxID=282301 RepID=A0A1I8GT00_9PLAT